jgi:hypothetical protein
MIKKIRQPVYTMVGTVLLALAATACVSWADEPIKSETEPAAELSAANEPTDEVEKEIVAKSEKDADKRRESILNEATDALERTEQALKALEEKRIDDALADLAIATGKLDLIVARDPSLALAPTDVAVTYREIFASNADIKAVINAADKALGEGRVQDARHMLSKLGSEVVTTVTQLPLATYPDAIKDIVPLIDDGEIELAKQELETALGTVVLTDYVTPLPYLRAEQMLTQAEKLAETSERSDEQNEELASILSAVREELNLGELLGYGTEGNYASLYEELDKIEGKTSDGKHGKGFFDQMTNRMAEWWSSLTN